MSPYIYTALVRDNLRIGRLIGWALVALVIFGITLVWKSVAKMTPVESYGQIVDIIVFRFLALGAAVASTTVVTQEVEQKTIVYLLTRPQPRWWILLGRMLAAATTTTIIGWMALLGAGIAMFGGAVFGQPSFQKDLVVIALGSLAYVSFFTLLSLWVNKALIVCLLFAFGWEGFVQNMSTAMSRISVSTYLNSLADHPQVQNNSMAFLSGDLTAAQPSTAASIGVMLAIFAGCAAIGMWWFSTNEYIAREDGE